MRNLRNCMYVTAMVCGVLYCLSDYVKLLADKQLILSYIGLSAMCWLSLSLLMISPPTFISTFISKVPGFIYKQTLIEAIIIFLIPITCIIAGIAFYNHLYTFILLEAGVYWFNFGVTCLFLLQLIWSYQEYREKRRQQEEEESEVRVAEGLFRIETKLLMQEINWQAIDEKYRFEWLSTLPTHRAKKMENADLSQCGEFQEWYREQVIIPNSGGVYGNKLYRMYKERPAENE